MQNDSSEEMEIDLDEVLDIDDEIQRKIFVKVRKDMKIFSRQFFISRKCLLIQSLPRKV